MNFVDYSVASVLAIGVLHWLYRAFQKGKEVLYSNDALPYVSSPVVIRERMEFYTIGVSRAAMEMYIAENSLVFIMTPEILAEMGRIQLSHVQQLNAGQVNQSQMPHAAPAA
jgi:hypothetical protein